MSKSYGKLNKGHEEAIYALRKAGKSGRQVRIALAQGVPGERAVSVHLDTIYRVDRRLKDERDELYTSDIQKKPAPEGLRMLTRRLMIIAEREIVRLEGQERKGRLDASKLGKLALALTKLHGLLERSETAQEEDASRRVNEAVKEDAAPPTFAESLINGDAPAEREDEGPAVADVVVKPELPVAL